MKMKPIKGASKAYCTVSPTHALWGKAVRIGLWQTLRRAGEATTTNGPVIITAGSAGTEGVCW